MTYTCISDHHRWHYATDCALTQYIMLLLICCQGSAMHQRIDGGCAAPQAAGYDGASFKLLVTHFWHRLIGTSLGWFCNDFLFYGNATFRNRFIRSATTSCQHHNNIITASSQFHANSITTPSQQHCNVIKTLSQHHHNIIVLMTSQHHTNITPHHHHAITPSSQHYHQVITTSSPHCQNITTSSCKLFFFLLHNITRHRKDLHDNRFMQTAMLH